MSLPTWGHCVFPRLQLEFVPFRFRNCFGWRRAAGIRAGAFRGMFVVSGSVVRCRCWLVVCRRLGCLFLSLFGTILRRAVPAPGAVTISFFLCTLWFSLRFLDLRFRSAAPRSFWFLCCLPFPGAPRLVCWFLDGLSCLGAPRLNFWFLNCVTFLITLRLSFWFLGLTRAALGLLLRIINNNKLLFLLVGLLLRIINNNKLPFLLLGLLLRIINNNKLPFVLPLLLLLLLLPSFLLLLLLLFLHLLLLLLQMLLLLQLLPLLLLYYCYYYLIAVVLIH